MRFPRSIFTDCNTIMAQVKHIESEIDEVAAELAPPLDTDKIAMELWDVIHSAETALRMLAERYKVDIHGAREEVIIKNRKRLYYGVQT